jgi:hypothetical protein
MRPEFFGAMENNGQKRANSDQRLFKRCEDDYIRVVQLACGRGRRACGCAAGLDEGRTFQPEPGREYDEECFPGMMISDLPEPGQRRFSSLAIIITTTVQRNSRKGRHHHMFRQWREPTYFVQLSCFS